MRSIGSDAYDALFAIRRRKYEHASCFGASRTDVEFPSREVLSLQRYPEDPETSHGHGKGVPFCSSGKNAACTPKIESRTNEHQLVMNGFSRPDATSKSKVPKHLESLATTVFSSMFPPINPQATPIKSIRRVLLLNREQSKEDDGTFIINFRHFAITTRRSGVSKQLRRINAAEQFLGTKTSRRSQMPNLGKLEDIADYMIGGEGGDGYVSDLTSGSEVDTDAEVEVQETASRKVLSAKARAAAAENGQDEELEEGNVERHVVKLVELGPRMRLRLTKVEEGMCSGKVMWHEYIHKSTAEIKELEKRWEKRTQEKEARRREQKANVEKKKAAKAAQKAANKGGKGDDDEDDDEDDYEYYSDMDVDELDSEGLAGDAEFKVNEQKEEDGEWEDQEEEIGNK